MRIICRPGTVARFALLCIILGILLGFFLGMHVRGGQTPAQVISIGPSILIGAWRAVLSMKERLTSAR